MLLDRKFWLGSALLLVLLLQARKLSDRRHSSSRRRFAAALVLGALCGTPAHAQWVEKKTLSLALAQRYADAAQTEALRRHATVVITVVDDGGYPLVLRRLDDTQVASVEVSIAKARTAAVFRRPSREFEEQVRNGRLATLVLPGAAPLQGGLPITFDHKVVGAIGVSGNSPQEDEDIAQAGIDGVDKAASTAVTYRSAPEVEQAFASGSPLLETAQYRVVASRRDHAGEAEVHARETDVIYVTQGKALLVTGGHVIRGQSISADEIRGTGIESGIERALAPGDVVIIPAGVPHWFKTIDPPFLYFTVKPISTTGP